MKPYRLLAAAAILAAIFIVPASAQPAAGRPATPGATPTAPATGTDVTRIAIIDTSAFDDPQGGIGRLVNAINNVNRQFQPRQTEIQSLQQRITTLAEEINRTANLAQAAEIQRKREEAERLQTELTRKREDAQREYNRSLEQALNPIYEDISKVLQEFARQRQIAIIIDAARIPNTIFITSDSVNITRDFITEYNRRNPAAAASTPPATTPARPAANTGAPARRP